MNSVYMDNNATTSLKKEVLDAMMPYYTDIYGNASSKFYKIGRDAEQALYKLRESVAKSLNAKNVNEIYFTGSGCEADNWAIKGIALANKSKGNHIITSKIEHHAILSTCEYLEKHGFEVTYLDVDEYGFVSPKAVEDAIKDNTILISIAQDLYLSCLQTMKSELLSQSRKLRKLQRNTELFSIRTQYRLSDI